MSALAGVLHWDHRRHADLALPRRMLGAAARGDSHGAAFGPVAIAAAAADTAPAQHGRVVVAADADLLNLEELAGQSGVSSCGAVLADLYQRARQDAPRHLRGSFAIAVWDPDREELTLALDHFGIKCLYYASLPWGLVFATRAGSVAAVSGVGADVDPTAVYEYLNFGCVPAPRSIWCGVRRLPPGHMLIARHTAVTTRPYWDLHYAERPISLAEAKRATERAVAAAVEATMGGASPKETGAFLSGGTDSSTVVGLMARLTGEPVKAFSIGFNEPRYDELDYAALAARHFGAAHHTRIISADEAFAVVPELVDAYDEPFGNNSAIGTLFCARLARDAGVSSLLAGDGGDEIFGGNERYRRDRIFALWGRLPRALRAGLLEPGLLALGHRAPGLLGRAQRYVRRARIPNPRRFYSYEFYFAQEGQALLDPGFVDRAGVGAPWQVLEGHFARAQARSELNRLLYLDMKLTLGDSDLPKVTRTAALAGIGVRFPLLDVPLVEFTAALPARFKVRYLEKRYLFKRAFRALLPEEILAKPKHGFGVPTGLWLRSHRQFSTLARDTLLSSAARQRGYLRAGAMDDLFARHAGDTTPYYGDLLWTLLMLELWHRRHAGSGRS